MLLWDIFYAVGMAADEYYCLQMLELAGVILVPGSGFGQQQGEHRISIQHTAYVWYYTIMLEQFCLIQGGRGGWFDQ